MGRLKEDVINIVWLSSFAKVELKLWVDLICKGLRGLKIKDLLLLDSTKFILVLVNCERVVVYCKSTAVMNMVGYLVQKWCCCWFFNCVVMWGKLEDSFLKFYLIITWVDNIFNWSSDEVLLITSKRESMVIYYLNHGCRDLHGSVEDWGLSVIYVEYYW